MLIITYSKLPRIISHLDVNKLLSVLPEKKKKKTKDYIKLETKLQSIFGHLLVQCTLETQLNCPVKNEDYIYNSHNKPSFKNIPFHFNISHSKNYVFCAISDQEVGIDIEFIDKDHNNFLEEASLFLDSSEYAYLSASKKKVEVFFKYWTSKEAFLKKIGMGLSRSLTSIGININNSNALDKYTGKLINVLFINLIPNYQIAICSERKTIDKVLYIDSQQLIKYIKP